MGAQKQALKNIYRIIFFLSSPNEAAIKAPPTGENNTGVKKAIPIKPHLLDTLTVLRVAGENIFLFLKSVFFKKL